MFGIGFQEVIIILIIAMLVVGPERLPELGRQAGKIVRDLRRVYANLRSELGPEFDEIEQGIRDIRGLDPRQQVRDYGRTLLSDLGKDAPELKQVAEGRRVSLEQAGRNLLNDSLLDKPLAETRMSDAVASVPAPASTSTVNTPANAPADPPAPRNDRVAESNGHFE